MRRACKVTLKFANARKREAIEALLCRYRSAINFFIRSLWVNPGRLDAATLARLHVTELSQRYKSQALKQALEICVATRKSAAVLGRQAKSPIFHGDAVLDTKFLSVEVGRGSFDLVVRISSLIPGQRLTVPTKRTAVLNKWLAVPNAVIAQGCALSETNLVLWVEIPDCNSRTKGTVVGIDIGINKLLSDSDGAHYGREFRSILMKIRRREPGSNGRRRAYAERENYINRTINQLPWESIAVIGIEKLHDMKRGKNRKRGKAFRKAVAPWLYRRVIERIGCKAQERRSRLVEIDPAYTSQDCPACKARNSLNRHGEVFLCIACGHAGDADTVGAQNILARTWATLGSVESPRLKRSAR